jgi:hypothetical protein
MSDDALCGLLLQILNATSFVASLETHHKKLFVTCMSLNTMQVNPHLLSFVS